MPPRRVLHVAEKPAVAKELAAVLSGGRHSRRQGPSQYNCIWEFSSDFQGMPSISFHVTSVTGHLMLVC
jgi:DNA topoisomerase-3